VASPQPVDADQQFSRARNWPAVDRVDGDWPAMHAFSCGDAHIERTIVR